jgi:hypothetical protein
MKLKGVIITCIVVVLYLSLCSWRFERLDEVEGADDKTLVVNVK